jgi:hypothetical protein
VVASFEGPKLSVENNSSSPSVEGHNDLVCAKTISTYPLRDQKNRDGDPICDRFAVELYSNRAIIAVADGCNWGKRPLEAAVKGIQGFVKHLVEQQK